MFNILRCHLIFFGNLNSKQMIEDNIKTVSSKRFNNRLNDGHEDKDNYRRGLY